MNQFFQGKGQSISKPSNESNSFSFKSQQFSQKNNNSLNNLSASFFNQSSIRKNQINDSGEFIYFNDENETVLSNLGVFPSKKALQNESTEQKNKNFLKSKQQQNKIKQQQQNSSRSSINDSKSISFQDSLRQSNQYLNDSQLPDYGTGKSPLPPTVKKPKFGFKIHETAASSEIMDQIGLEYQIKGNSNKKHNQNSCDSNESQLPLRLRDSIARQTQKIIYKNNDSLSSIKGPHPQPSLNSQYFSQSNVSQPQLNGMKNFKQVIQTNNKKHKKQKRQKASSINSSIQKLTKSRSHKLIMNNSNSENSILKDSIRFDLNAQDIKIAQLKNLRQLQNKLGQLKHQNDKIVDYLIQKDDEIDQLNKKKQELKDNDPYTVKKENQLMRAFLNKKEIQEMEKQSRKINKNTKNNALFTNSKKNQLKPQAMNTGNLGFSNFLHSGRSLKQISLRKSSYVSSLHEYDTKSYKLKINPRNLSKQQKKFILSNRGMLLSNDLIDIGYSLKDKSLTIYLTVKKQCQQISVKLKQNSFTYSEPIDKVIRKCSAGKQIKFKTDINSTKIQSQQEQFVTSQFLLSLNSQHKFQVQKNQYKVSIPLSVYSIAQQIQPQYSMSISRIKQSYKTQSFICSQEMIKNPEAYLSKIFPLGVYSEEDQILFVGYQWKHKIWQIRIKIKQRSFLVEGDGNPKDGAFEIVQAIVELLKQRN